MQEPEEFTGQRKSCGRAGSWHKVHLLGMYLVFNFAVSDDCSDMVKLYIYFFFNS